LPYEIVVSTPLGNTRVVRRIMPGYEIKVGKEVLRGDLIEMETDVYDVILGMDWLSRHGARVDCKDKRVQFVRLGRDVLEHSAKRIKEYKFMIAGTKARKMIAKDCQGYLAYLLNKLKDQCTLEGTLVVKDYQDVFPEKLTFLPPSREVEFANDLVPQSPEHYIGWLQQN
jgi:hypothetical protein